MSFNITKMQLTILQLLATSTPIVTSIEEKPRYSDGKPTDIMYTALTVTAPEVGFDPLITVKLDTKPDTSLTTEKLVDDLVRGVYHHIELNDFKAKIWFDRAGNSQVSATASSVNFIDNDAIIDV